MKTKMKTFISMITVLCLLTAFLSGCGSTQIVEASETTSASQRENRPEQSQNQKNDQKMDGLEMEKMEIPEENVAALLQAGMDAVAQESDLWAISEITDTEILMQLTQPRGGKERPEGELGEFPENMTPPDGAVGNRHDGEMPEGTMPKQGGETPPENMDSRFPEGEMGEGHGKQPENRGDGMAALAIVISGTEDTTLASEDILTQIQLAAEELGYQANSTELTEEQQSVIEVSEGYSVKLVVLISAQMPEMDAGEAVG